MISLFACDAVDQQEDSNPFKVNFRDGKASKIIELSNAAETILPVDKVEFIIIEDVDTALYVVVEGDTLGVCDAVYHDAQVPWGQIGKRIIAVYNNFAHSFIIIQDRDGARRLTSTVFRRDSAASIVQVSKDVIGIRDMQFSDGATKDFNSNESTISTE